MENPEKSHNETDPKKDPLGFIQEVQVAINSRDETRFRQLVINKEIFLPGVFWDVAVEVSKCLTTSLQEEDSDFFETCETGLWYLIDNGNPKEMFIVILEQAEGTTDQLKFRTLLNATQKILLKLPGRRVKSFDEAVATFMKHVTSLELPNEHNLEGEEKKLLEGDPNVRRIGEVVELFLQFLLPFVNEVSVKNPKNSRSTNQHQIQELTRCLLKLLSQPLLFVDLTHVDESGAVTKTRCREAAETTVEYLSQLQVDFHNLTLSVLEENELAQKQRDELNERRRCKIEDNMTGAADIEESFQELDLEDPVPTTGLACFTYIVLGEQLGLTNWPQVFCHKYMLMHSLPFIRQLLEGKKSLVVHKGIFLAESVLDKVPRKSLESDLLEIKDFQEFVLVLTDVMLNCPITELRQLAVKMLPYYVNKFDLKGRYHLMFFLLKKVSHAGVAGLVIQMIKDQLSALLKSTDSPGPFAGHSLESLFRSALTLPDGATSDLLDQSDRVMAGLNLVRFLVLSDPPTVNRSGIWNRLEVLESQFLEPLKTGINMSRAHYEMELQTMEQSKSPENVELSLTLGGIESPPMPKEQKLEILRKACVQFDVMDSIHGRVCEVISMQKKAAKADV